MHNKATVYMIRHGEKPPKIDGKDQIGLSASGLDRAHALVQVFGRESNYDIGYIMAQHPKKNGRRARPYDTIRPLAESLGPDVEIDTSIDRDDAEDVAHKIRHYKGPGNILLCWEHGRLEDIAKALGVEGVEPYPSNRYDVIWTIEPPYVKIDDITSEHCPGIDDEYADSP